MELAARALARSRAWALLGDYFKNGVTEATRAAWEQAAPGVPLVSEHARLYLLEVAPFESVFCGSEGLVGGPIADAVREARAQGGLPSVREPDHLGEELQWIGFLAGAEADALRDGAAVEHVRVRLRAAYDGHLLRWLLVFAGAVDAMAPPALDTLALDTAVALAIEHRVALQGHTPAWILPGHTPILDQPRVGLRAIAEHLCVPTQAGGWVGRSAITRIARSLELPTSFGARADMLEGLLGSAAHYGRIPEVMAALIAELDRWDRRLDVPAVLEPLVGPWRERRQQVRAVLRHISSSAEGIPANPR